MRFDFWADDPAQARLCSFEAAAAATLASAVVPVGEAAVLSGLAASAAVPAATTSIFTFGNILSAASAFSSLAGGFLQGQQLDAQAELEGLRAKSELLEGQRQVVEQKEQLVIDLAAHNARVAGGGSTTAHGSPAAAQDAAIADSNFQTDITRSGAAIRAATRRTSAGVLRSRATGARVSGVANGLATGARQVARNQGR